MSNPLAYDAHSKKPKEHDTRRNGYGNKTLKTSFGEAAIDVPRDRQTSFEPELIPKRRRDIAATVEDEDIFMTLIFLSL